MQSFPYYSLTICHFHFVLCCCGRVLKAMDSKSIGVSPCRFGSCWQRTLIFVHFPDVGSIVYLIFRCIRSLRAWSGDRWSHSISTGSRTDGRIGATKKLITISLWFNGGFTSTLSKLASTLMSFLTKATFSTSYFYPPHFNYSKIKKKKQAKKITRKQVQFEFPHSPAVFMKKRLHNKGCSFETKIRGKKSKIRSTQANSCQNWIKLSEKKEFLPLK